MFNSIVAFDVETATNKRSSICQIGIAVVRNGEIAERKSWLIQPPDNKYYSFNTQLHGIGPEDTKDKPLFPVVWKDINEYVKNKIVVCHYSAFDMGALREALNLYGMEYPTFDIMCTIWPSKKTIPGLSRYTLDAIYSELFGKEMENHHNAEDDAAACAEILVECLRRNNISNRDDVEKIFKLKIGHISPDSYTNQHAVKLKSRVQSKIKIIEGNVEKNDPDSYFYGKCVCFTGTMSFSFRNDLKQYIADIGGIPVNAVTRETDILVVGQQDYRIVGESGMSAKQRKALDLLNKGYEIEILSESDFLRYAADFSTK